MLPALFDLLAKRDFTALRQALDSGADPNTLSPFHGQSVLYNACVVSDLESARILLEHGADPNLRMSIRSVTDGSIVRDVTVLMYATSADVARLLIEFGADVNAQDDAGTTALMKAANFGKLEVLEVLIEKGADTQARQSGAAKKTALEFAEAKLQFWRKWVGKPGMKADGVAERIECHEAIVRLLRP